MTTQNYIPNIQPNRNTALAYHLQVSHWIWLLLLAVTMLIASIQPLDMPSYLLHQIGTVLMLVFLFFALFRFGLSQISFALYIGFLLIHVLGAHYLYSYVPYNEWSLHYLGWDINQSLGWNRNMYDRLVHFAFGLLLYPFFFRLFQVWLPQLSAKILFLLVIQFVMASSLVYEWIEWLLAMGLSPEEAENYNGQQGDIWDAHKDMLLATVGAICTGVFMLITHRKNARHSERLS